MSEETKSRNTLRPEDPFRPQHISVGVDEIQFQFEGTAEEHSLRVLAEAEWERRQGGLGVRSHLMGVEAARVTGALGRFARWLAVREREDEAIQFAVMALQIAEDAALRGELVGWYAKLGRLVEAAGALAPLAKQASSRERAEICQRRAIFLAKAGSFEDAHVVLEEALRALPGDPLSLELSGATARRVAGKSDVAAARFLAAANVRRDRGEKEVAVFDLYRAMAVGAGSSEPARTLAAWHAASERHAQAHEVLRAEADRLRDLGNSSGAEAVERERVASAIEAEEPLLALLAMLDLGEDRRFGGDTDRTVNALLLQVGLLEWLAGRTLIAALLVRDPAERSLRFDALESLYQGPLASRDLAEDARRLSLRTSGLSALCARMNDGLSPEARDALVAMCRSSDVSARRAAAEELLGRVGQAHPGFLVVAVRALAVAGTEAGRGLLVEAIEEASVVESEVARLRTSIARSPEDIEQALPFLERAIEWPSLDGEVVESFVLLIASFARRGYVPMSMWRIGDRLAMRMGDPRERLSLWKRLLSFDGESMRGRALAAAAEVRSHLVRRVVQSALECGDSTFAMATLKLELPRADASLVAMTVALGRTLGDEEGAARAMARLTTDAPRVEAGLAALASEWLAPFDAPLARICAERACHADPQMPRAVVALANTAVMGEPRVRAAALERTGSLVAPTVSACAECVALLGAAKEADLALSWARRWASLVPGAPEAIAAVLGCSLATRDCAVIVDAVEWALSQMCTREELAAAIDAPVAYLEREDASRAVTVARRVLRTVGLPTPAWATRLRVLAKTTGDMRLALSLAATQTAATGPAAQLELAAFARESGDTDAEVRYLVRAIEAGARDEAAIDRVRELQVARMNMMAGASKSEDILGAVKVSGDAMLRLVEASTLLASTESLVTRGRALREYGFALWELGGDDAGAVSAWREAAATSPAQGFAVMRGDLVRAFGKHGAFEVLEAQATKARDARTSAGLCREAAHVAHDMGAFDRAFALAIRALDLDPERADALGIAERAAAACNGLDRLDAEYDRVADRARGRYGRRAAHFRAARFFLGAGRHGLAFRHAESAFTAVPTEGSSFRILCEAAERGHDRSGVARALEHVASIQRGPAERAVWLLKAAEFTGVDAEGTTFRAELVLSALGSAPTAGAASRLREVLEDVARVAPAARESLARRVLEVWESIRKRLEGPDGARIAIGFARAHVDAPGPTGAAWPMLNAALELDADIDEYATLIPFVTQLATEPGALERAVAHVQKPFANVGTAALEFLRALTARALRRDLGDLVAALSARKRDRGSDDLLGSLRGESLSPPAAASPPPPSPPPASPPPAVLEPAVLSLVSLPPASPPPVSPPLSARVEPRPSAPEDSLVRTDHPARPSIDPVTPSAAKKSVLPDGSAEVSQGVLGIEQALREHQDYEGLAGYLARRIEAHERAPGSEDLVRALRLRRAAVLEQHLDRVPEARAELDRTLALVGPQASTRRYALDLAERVQDWDYMEARLSAWLGEDKVEEGVRSEWTVRLGRILLARGAFDRAEALASRIATELASVGELCLVARVARARDDRGRRQGALECLETLPTGGEDDAERANVFLEEAQDALARGDTDGAIHWSRAGERVERPKGPVALFAVALRYKLTRWTAIDAKHAESVLETIGIPQLNTDDLALRALLLAEARDENTQMNEGLRVLRDAEKRVGRHPLIAIGIAERLARLGQHESALPYFDIALAGNSFGLRRAGGIALLAADAARSIGQDELACRYLERAAEDPRLLSRARRRLADVLLVIGRVDEARRVLRELVPRVTGDERAHALRELALTFSGGDTAQEADRRRLLGEARDAAESETVRVEIDRELTRHRESMLPPLSVEGDPSSVASVASISSARTVASRASARIRVARELLSTDSAGSEAMLRRAVDEGSLDACDDLASLLERRRAPWTDIVALRRIAAERSPGNLARLESLARAAREDKNIRYVAALDHVVSCFGPRHLVRLPPPLFLQSRIGGMAQFLMQPVFEGAGEVLAALWGDARDLWTRRYSRPPTARSSPLPARFLETVEASLSLLDCGRVQVEATRTSLESGFELRLAGPTIVVCGDLAQDSSEIRFALGRALSAVHPMNVLALGTSAETFARLWKAVEIAFGERRADDDTDARGMIAGLWEMVSAANQRRIRAWLAAHPGAIANRLTEDAHQSGRRMGLFVAGDFGVVARVIAREHGLPETEADTAYGLEALCRDVPAMTDLYRLAVSPEYAEARWSAWSQTAGGQGT